MNKNDDSTIALAGEYVMGTLPTGEHRAVKNMLSTDPLLQHWVHYWEAQLPHLHAGITTQKPPTKVWHKLHQTIKKQPIKIYDWQRPYWWQNVIWWRGLAMSMMLILVSGAVVFQQGYFQPMNEPIYIAVIRAEDNSAIWHVSIEQSSHKLLVTSLKNASISDGKVHELWLLAKDAQTPPKSMGILPEHGSQPLPFLLNEALATAAGVAVSLEPTGGSPLSVPSGAVLFQAGLNKII